MKSPLRFALAPTLVLAIVCLPQAHSQDSATAVDPILKIPSTDKGLPGVGPIRRYDWFQNLWTKRRFAWLQQKAEAQGSVVFLGDSITQGWGDRMGESFGELKVANRGISGDTTRGMLLRLDADVLALNPSAVVMLMGTNDLEEKATPEQVAANFSEIIRRLKAANAKMPIVVCQVFPSSAKKSRPAEAIRRVNELYAAAVKGDPQVTVLDTWTLFADENGDAKASEFPDLLHPNKLGYQKWASALRPVLATLRLIETEPDNFSPEPGFTSLFNGRNLEGWCFRPTTEQQLAQRQRWKNRPAWPVVKEQVNFGQEKVTPEGRYAAINGRLVVTTPPEGRKIQQLWTIEEFPEDFTLKLEFRATPNADSGIFLRGKQLQCRDFLLAGPYKQLKNYKAGDWNTMTITVTGETAHCVCNDEVLEEAFKLPASGPIGLEGDRGQIEYRRIRISGGR